MPVTNSSPPAEKIALFRSLFRGRQEVYPLRFESVKTGRAGYSPVCGNEWVRGVCEKPRIKCSDCPHQKWLPVTDEVIRRHLSGVDERGKAFVAGVKQELERSRAAGDERWHREILARYERRRGDLGLFLKEVKLRITFYMNKRLGRTGTLWEGRYKSVLVEDCERALLTMAAYIDLNPVRAGIASSPEDYRWCGYGEAVGGGRRAQRTREGLGLMLSEALQDPEFRQDWRRASARYRMFLYQDGREVAPDPELGRRGRRGMKPAEVEAVMERSGAIPVRQILRHRVRYFCDGAVLGTAEFVSAVFEREQSRRNRFGEKRSTGARRMRGADWGELRVLRDLQKDVIGT